jgi:CheY-like chemotaxis protein
MPDSKIMTRSQPKPDSKIVTRSQPMPDSKIVTILLVDDDEVDRRALLRAFERLKIANPVEIARDGVEGWEKLQTLKRPYLVILDINMPRMNGIELLATIRASERYRDSIVFVLTTSNDEQDKLDAYNFNVAGYMVKTDMEASFMRAIELIETYWKVVEFPVAAPQSDAGRNLNAG